MRISKSQLRNIIKEEIEAVKEAVGSGKLGRGEMTKQVMALSRGKAGVEPGEKAVTGGVTDEERGTITDLAQKMLKAASKTNLEAGQIDKLVDRLLLSLGQILGDEARPSPPAEPPVGE